MDMEYLREVIRDRGIPMTTIAEKTGILRETIYNRLDQPELWRVEEVKKMSSVLKLSKTEMNRIFDLK